MNMNDFIPDGFVPLADWDSRNRRNNDGHSVEWKTLSDAVKASEIPGFKLSNGRWYVHAESASSYLKKQQAAPAESSAKPTYSGGIGSRQVESAVIALCEINNGITLIQATLERLVLAVESIVTKPQRDPLQEFANVNGFRN